MRVSYDEWIAAQPRWKQNLAVLVSIALLVLIAWGMGSLADQYQKENPGERPGNYRN